MYFSIMFLENGNLIIQSQVLRLEREEGGQVLHKLWRRTLTFRDHCKYDAAEELFSCTLYFRIIIVFSPKFNNHITPLERRIITLRDSLSAKVLTPIQYVIIKRNENSSIGNPTL